MSGKFTSNLDNKYLNMKARKIEDKTVVLLGLGLLHLSARQETGLMQKSKKKGKENLQRKKRKIA